MDPTEPFMALVIYPTTEDAQAADYGADYRNLAQDHSRLLLLTPSTELGSKPVGEIRTTRRCFDETKQQIVVESLG